MHLKQCVGDGNSPLLNMSIKESGIRNLLSPEANMVLEKGDVVWVVGEQEDVYQLVSRD